MSDRDKEHREKWGVPLEEVAGRTAGHMVDPPNITAVELLANIKRGSEVVLGGVASMPDVLLKIKELRSEQQVIIAEEKRIVDEYEHSIQPHFGQEVGEEEKRKLEMHKQEQLAPLHKRFKATRMDLAECMVGSLFKHVMVETAAVDGKRAEQMVTINNAMVLQGNNDLLKLFPEKKKRSLTNPLGH